MPHWKLRIFLSLWDVQQTKNIWIYNTDDSLI